MLLRTLIAAETIKVNPVPAEIHDDVLEVSVC